jgi:hypothetical protein
MPWWPQGLIN